MSFLDGDSLDDSVVVIPLVEKDSVATIETLEGLHFLARKGKRAARIWAPIKKCAEELLNCADTPTSLDAAKQIIDNVETPGERPFKKVNLSQIKRISEQSHSV